MATQVQLRGGTTSEHSSFTGAAREVTVDTDKDVVVVHDGSTAGGIPLAKEASVLPLAGGTMTGTIAGFTSTGIDDNATSTAITIDASETTELKCQAGDANVGAKIYHPTSTSARHIVKFQSNVGGTQVDKAVIDCAGNVGIGTTSPTVALQIRKRLSSVGQSTPETVLLLETDAGSGDMSAGNGTRILFKIADDETNPSVGASIDAVRANGDDSISSTDLVFSTSQNDETLDEALRITSDGRGLSQFTAKAWVNFNGIGTVAIRDSHNVSSITDNGTGQYRVYFTNNMSNTNYATLLGSGGVGGGSAFTRSDSLVGSFDYNSYNATTPDYADSDENNAMVFGD